MSLIKKLFRISIVILLLSAFQFSRATDAVASTNPKKASQLNQPNENLSFTTDSPVELLQKSIVNTQQILIKSKDALHKNPEALIQLVNTHVMPLLAIDIIAQLLVGKTRWQSATKAEKEQFITDITKMLAYSYTENIAQAGNYDLQVFPFSNDSWKGQRLILVTGKIINLKTNASSDLSIKMLNETPNVQTAHWKIYDLSVAGVSILDNFKAQFKDYKTLNDINLTIQKRNHELSSKNSK